MRNRARRVLRYKSPKETDAMFWAFVVVCGSMHEGVLKADVWNYAVFDPLPGADVNEAMRRAFNSALERLKKDKKQEGEWPGDYSRRIDYMLLYRAQDIKGKKRDRSKFIGYASNFWISDRKVYEAWGIEASEAEEKFAGLFEVSYMHRSDEWTVCFSPTSETREDFLARADAEAEAAASRPRDTYRSEEIAASKAPDYLNAVCVAGYTCMMCRKKSFVWAEPRELLNDLLLTCSWCTQPAKLRPRPQ